MKAFLIILLCVLALFLLFILASYIMFMYVCKVGKRSVKPEDVLKTRKKQMPEYADQFEKGFEYIKDLPVTKYSIMSRDNLRLSADYIDCDNKKGIFVLFHGYLSTPYADFVALIPFLRSLGYGIFLPYQRAHTESEGKYLTFASYERFDCLDWLKKVNSEFGDTTPIYLMGISMGCATVLSASEFELPDNLKGIIADCGYTTTSEIITHVMKLWMNLPKFPFFYSTNIFCKIFAKYSYYDVDTVKALKNNTKPVLFIHGTKDTFVPPYMTDRNYEACTAPKELLMVKDAPHGFSHLKDPETYQKAVRKFAEEHNNI